MRYPRSITSRAFTLVELMIAIAIIGILFVSLTPSLGAYLKRSRDAARITMIRDLGNGISNFYLDKEYYPHAGTNQSQASYSGGLNDGCIPLTTLLVGKYLDKNIIDPVINKSNGCGNNGNFGYGSGVTLLNAPQFIIVSYFETDRGGNILYGLIDGTMTGRFLSGTRSDLDRGIFAVTYQYDKGIGSGYLFFK